MNSKAKGLIVIALLLAAIVFSYAVPVDIAYRGSEFISRLQVPDLQEWTGTDMSDILRANLQDARYKFISESLAYQYADKDDKELLFMVINARDFHYPNACFSSSGFKVRDLGTSSFDISGRTLSINALLAGRETQNIKTLVVYWIVIDKNLVTSWAEQKLKQLYFSLFDKKSVGVLVRLDIPVKEDGIDQGMVLAERFINDMSGALDGEDADHLFGQRK